VKQHDSGANFMGHPQIIFIQVLKLVLASFKGQVLAYEQILVLA